MVECDGARPFFERAIQCTIEMKLEQANTANTAHVQKLPVLLGQERLFLDRQLPLQGPQDTFEHQTVFFLGHIVARKVNIDAPASQLWIDLTEGSHFIRPHENMADPSGILKV